MSDWGRVNVTSARLSLHHTNLVGSEYVRKWGFIPIAVLLYSRFVIGDEMRMVLVAILVLIPQLLTAQEVNGGSDPRWSIDSYVHGGEMRAKDGPRVDSARFLSVLSAAVSFRPTERFAVRLGAGSVLGFVIPSLEANLGAEYYFMRGRFSPFLRLGARGILNVGIECVNDHATCVEQAEENRADRPAADAFGPLLLGFAGEAGAGAEVRLREFSIAGWGSYLAGPLNLNENGNPLLKKVYHGWLVSVALRYYFPGKSGVRR